MHELVLLVALLWLATLAAACVVLVVRARSLAGRILAVDTLILVLVGLLVLYSAYERASYFLDAALILALLGFAGTLAAARYYGEEGPFG